MSSELKSWLLMPVSPALMALHHYTQWQGLLNVLGVIYFLGLLLALAIVAGIIFAVYNSIDLPNLGDLSKKSSKPLQMFGWAVFIAVTGYLFWTDHVVVGTLYLLCCLTSYAAMVLARLYAEAK